MAVVLLVRHAQASFGATDYDALSAIGEQQGGVLAARLAALPRVDRVVHGTMQRQRHTAELGLATRSDAPAFDVDAGWDEYDHEAIFAAALGDPAEHAVFSNRMPAAADPRRVFQEQFDVAMTRWTGGTPDTDYTETFTAFTTRVATALDTLVTGLDRSETAVVVTSGGVIAAVCAAQLGLGPDRWVALNHVIVNTSITKLVHGRSGTTLLSINDHGHLEVVDPALLTYR